jgi:hypothetical protein
MVKCSSMHSCLHSSSLELKKLLVFNVNGVLCYFHHWLFCKGMLKCLEKMLTRPKRKLELEWKIIWINHFKSFIMQFDLVWNLKMYWKFFPCSWLKVFWINSFSFGDVNNVPKHLVKFHPCLIITKRIWNMFIMLVMGKIMERIKHC